MFESAFWIVGGYSSFPVTGLACSSVSHDPKLSSAHRCRISIVEPELGVIKPVSGFRTGI